MRLKKHLTNRSQPQRMHQTTWQLAKAVLQRDQRITMAYTQIILINYAYKPSIPCVLILLNNYHCYRILDHNPIWRTILTRYIVKQYKKY